MNRRGAVLLEVVLSLALLAFGLAVVGLQVNTAFRLAQETDLGTRAAILMESKFAELQGGVLQLENLRDEVEGDFGIYYPGFTWRLQIEPCEIQDLYMLQMEIGYNPEAAEDMIEQPETTESKFTDAGTRTLLTTYRLYPKPADINMERDYGYTAEEIDEFLQMASASPTDGTVSMEEGTLGDDTDQSSGSGDSGTSGQQSTGNALLDALQAAGIDADMLQQLMDPNGIDPRQLTQLSDEDFMKFSALIDVLQGQGDLSDLQQQLANSGLSDLSDATGDAQDGGTSDAAEQGSGRRSGTGRTRGGSDREGRAGGRRGQDDAGMARGDRDTEGGRRAGRGHDEQASSDDESGGNTDGSGRRAGRGREGRDNAADNEDGSENTRGRGREADRGGRSRDRGEADGSSRGTGRGRSRDNANNDDTARGRSRDGGDRDESGLDESGRSAGRSGSRSGRGRDSSTR